jgi:hypothetical protein
VRDGLLRVAEATDLRRARTERQAVDSLEVAVRENAELAVALTAVVARMEADLVPVLEASLRRS